MRTNGNDTACSRPPSVIGSNLDFGAVGLSKRELAVFMAMQGLLANKEAFGPSMQGVPENVAYHAVRMADATLKALNDTAKGEG